MSRLRLGAVEYLNARPLVYGLQDHASRFDVRFDVPSRCAALLHANEVDVGLVPSIEYLRGDSYVAVPGVAIGSDGPIDSVAVFGKVPIDRVRTVALDASSRTSVALFKVLCARHFGIEPAVRVMAPEPLRMLEACDAALLIGDVALFFDHGAAGLEKTDLGLAWKAFTGLPFVYAYWFGRPGLITPPDVTILGDACRRGVEHAEDVARQHCPGDERLAAVGARYLRDNVDFGFGERELAGLTRFYREAADLGLVPSYREPRFD
ncbi:MAG: menaquinone biosynthesis protein [Acidobacteria bacterium]|nr:menaquinone biosynthesis protein [Acidobacteriota bacterium]